MPVTDPIEDGLDHLAERNLTQWEFLALNGELNVADGHARQLPTPGQRKIIDDLPALFVEAEQRPVNDIEVEAHRAFLEVLGQSSYPNRPGRVLSCYSSSVAMEILARSLAHASRPVALVHPTFDNIADLLRGNGLQLVPLSEDPLHDEDLPRSLLDAVSCVAVTTPNNPTGRVLAKERLRRLAAQCAEHDVVLALDTSFRGFDPRAQYDHYAVLRASGCRWVVIEDSGKLWPTLDLKVGLLVSAEHVNLPIASIYSDILLGVSPLILLLVRQLALDARDGGLADLHRFIAENRATVREGLAGLDGIGFPDLESRVSVERIELGRGTGQQVWAALRERNVYALPCRAFHWADPDEGDGTLRIALSRSPDTLTRSVQALRSVLEQS